jgi:hypothetical protein
MGVEYNYLGEECDSRKAIKERKFMGVREKQFLVS